jgi:hypothetical protein
MIAMALATGTLFRSPEQRTSKAGKVALEPVLRVLKEVGFVKLVENGRKIERIIPNIPVFDDVYEEIGKFAHAECALNSHEQATLSFRDPFTTWRG